MSIDSSTIIVNDKGELYLKGFLSTRKLNQFKQSGLRELPNQIERFYLEDRPNKSIYAHCLLADDTMIEAVVYGSDFFEFVATAMTEAAVFDGDKQWYSSSAIKLYSYDGEPVVDVDGSAIKRMLEHETHDEKITDKVAELTPGLTYDLSYHKDLIFIGKVCVPKFYNGKKTNPQVNYLFYDKKFIQFYYYKKNEFHEINVVDSAVDDDYMELIELLKTDIIEAIQLVYDKSENTHYSLTITKIQEMLFMSGLPSTLSEQKAMGVDYPMISEVTGGVLPTYIDETQYYQLKEILKEVI